MKLSVAAIPQQKVNNRAKGNGLRGKRRTFRRGQCRKPISTLVESALKKTGKTRQKSRLQSRSRGFPCVRRQTADVQSMHRFFNHCATPALGWT